MRRIGAGEVRQSVEGVEDDLDGGAVVAGDAVRDRPDHRGFVGLDAVIEKRAAGRLAAREISDCFADARICAEREDNAAGGPFAPQ